MLNTILPLMLLVLLGSAARAENDLDDNAALDYWQAFAQLPQLIERDIGGEEVNSDREILNNWRTADLEQKEVVDLLNRSKLALNQLSVASKHEACEWGLDFTQGLNLLMPHLAKSRDLGRLALLDARRELAAGNTDQAVARIEEVAKLSRDTGQPLTLISTLVEASLRHQTQLLISDSAAKLTDKQGAKLLAELDGLFPTLVLSKTLKGEADLLLPWLKAYANNPETLKDLGISLEEKRLQQGTAAFMKKEIALLTQDYQELIAAADGDLTELKKVEEQLVARAKAEPRLLTSLLMPSLTSTRASIDRANIRTEMLRVGLLLLTGNAAATKAIKAPLTNEPFQILEDDDSITVTSRYTDRDGKPLTLTFPRSS